MPIEFSKISSFQLDQLPKRKTVFFFSVGPLEDHGLHLPLGLDLEEASHLCWSSARHLEEHMQGWTGVMMPQVPLGIDSNTTHIAITVRPHVLRDWLVDACRSLMKIGFCHFVCFSGHLGPRQLTAIEDAGKMIRKSGRWRRWGRRILGAHEVVPSLVSASSTQVTWQTVLASPFWPDPVEHGGRRDTSIALAIAKDLVDPQYVKLSELTRSHSRWLRNLNRRRGRLKGYWGNPSVAQQSLGEKDLSEFRDQVFPKLRAVWEGTNPNSLFRSWYSVLPPNKSLFKAWLLVWLIGIFLGGWLFLHALMIP